MTTTPSTTTPEADTTSTEATPTTDDTTTEAAEATTVDQAEVEATQAPEDAQEAPSEGKEAAKYRRRLRETEAERDALTGRLETLQRAEVERLAGQTLTKPGGLWAAGTELAALLDDDGNVDPEKVAAAATAAIDTLGLQKRRPPGCVPDEGKIPNHYAGGNGWQGAFAAQ